MRTVAALAVAGALAFGTSAVLAEVELTILGGQTTFNNSSFHAEGDDNGGTDVGEELADALGDLEADDISSDFAPGLRVGVRLGDSPVLATLGARHSDHLDTSYDVGLRFNPQGAAYGAELRAVRFEEGDVRDAFGNRDVEGEAVVTYDVAKYLRLGAGVTTATLDDQDVNGLITADVVFSFGGEKAAPVLVPVAVPVPAPVVVPVPDVRVTGERG